MLYPPSRPAGMATIVSRVCTGTWCARPPGKTFVGVSLASHKPPTGNISARSGHQLQVQFLECEEINHEQPERHACHQHGSYLHATGVERSSADFDYSVGQIGLFSCG